MDQDKTTARVDSEDRPLDPAIQIIEEIRKIHRDLEVIRKQRDYWKEKTLELWAKNGRGGEA